MKHSIIRKPQNVVAAWLRVFPGVVTVLVTSLTTVWSQVEIVGVSWSLTNSPVVRIDARTGSGLELGLSGIERLNSLAQSPSGILYSVGGGLGGSRLVTIDPLTGAGQIQTDLNFGAVTVDVRGLAFSPAGVLYAINDAPDFQSDYLFTINVDTGVGTLIGTTGLPGLQGLEAAPDGSLYGWDVGVQGFGAGLVRLDPLTGFATRVNPTVSGSSRIQTIAFATDGILYGAGDGLYRIDVSTGVAALIGNGGYSDVRGIAVVPEPHGLALLALGAGIIAAYARLRRRKTLRWSRSRCLAVQDS